MRLIAGAASGKLKSIDQTSSALVTAIAEDKQRKYEQEQARVKKERIDLAKSREQEAIAQANFANSKTGIALETAKGVGSKVLDMGLALARAPLTIPLKVTQTLVEGVTGKPQVYTPETGVEKFFYGSEPIQSYTADQRSIQKFAEDKGLSKGAAIAAGAVGAGAETVADVALPGIGKALSKTFIGRALSKVTGRIPKEVSALDVHETVQEVVDVVGRNITPDEKTAVIESLSSGVKKEKIVEAVKKEQVYAAEDAIQAPKTAENITSWLSGAPKAFDEKTVAHLKRARLGVDELNFDKDGKITLYRDGKIELGKPQSYSLTKIDDKQQPVIVNKNDVLVNFNGDEVKLFMEQNFQRGDKSIAMESLDHWKNFEKEVIVLKEKPSTAKLSGGKSKSPILEEINKNLDEASKLDETLPTTTFKKQFAAVEKEIKKDPAAAYNKALRGEGTDEMTQSALQLALIKNALAKGDNKALAELGMAAARTGRKAGQTSVMFRALYEQDPVGRMLTGFARAKLSAVEARYPRILKKNLEEGSDIVKRTTRAVKKKASVSLGDAQSIIDNFICK